MRQQMSDQERQSLVQLSQNHDVNLMIRQMARLRTQDAKRQALQARGIATLHS